MKPSTRVKIKDMLNELLALPKERAINNPIIRAERAKRIAEIILISHGMTEEVRVILKEKLGEDWPRHFLEHELALLEPNETEAKTTTDDTDEEHDNASTTDEHANETEEEHDEDHDNAPDQTGALEPTKTDESAWDTLHTQILPPALQDEDSDSDTSDVSKSNALRENTDPSTDHEDTDDVSKSNAPRENTDSRTDIENTEHVSELQAARENTDLSSDLEDTDDVSKSNAPRENTDSSTGLENTVHVSKSTSDHDDTDTETKNEDEHEAEPHRPPSLSELLLDTTYIHLDSFDTDTDLTELAERHENIKAAIETNPQAAEETFTALQKVKRMGLEGIDLRGLLRYMSSTRINMELLKALDKEGHVKMTVDPQVTTRLSAKR